MVADLGLEQEGFSDCVKAVQEPTTLGFRDVEEIRGGRQVRAMQSQGAGMEVDGDLGSAGVLPAAAIYFQWSSGSSIGSRPFW